MSKREREIKNKIQIRSGAVEWVRDRKDSPVKWKYLKAILNDFDCLKSLKSSHSDTL